MSLVSAAVTPLHFLFGSVVVSRLPRLHARYGVARVTLIGACALALGVIGWAIARHHWQLFVAALLSGAGWVTMSAAGINAMVSPWFDRQRPMALSKAYNGASVGGMLFSPLWSFLIAQFGFAVAASIVSACTLAIMFWLTRRVLRFRPPCWGNCRMDALPMPRPQQRALPQRLHPPNMHHCPVARCGTTRVF